MYSHVLPSCTIPHTRTTVSPGILQYPRIRYSQAHTHTHTSYNLVQYPRESYGITVYDTVNHTHTHTHRDFKMVHTFLKRTGAEIGY